MTVKQSFALMGVELCIFAAFAAHIYPLMPNTVPVHWNIYMQADGYGSKQFALITSFITVLVAPVTALFLLASPVSEENKESVRKVQNYLNPAIGLFLTVMACVILDAAVNPSLPFGKILMSNMLVLYIVIANVYGKLRPNSTTGIRLPITMKSEEVWIATHRFAGRLGVFGSLLALVTVWLPLPNAIPLGIFCAIIVIPIVYPYARFGGQSRQ